MLKENLLETSPINKLRRNLSVLRYTSGSCSVIGSAGLAAEIVHRMLMHPAAQHDPKSYSQLGAYSLWGTFSSSIIYNAARGNSQGFKKAAVGNIIASFALLAGDPTKLQDLSRAFTAGSLLVANILQYRAKVLEPTKEKISPQVQKQKKEFNGLMASGLIKAVLSGPSFILAGVASHNPWIMAYTGLVYSHWLTQIGVGVMEGKIKRRMLSL